MKLKAATIKNAKSKDKTYKPPDGNGLFLEVPKNGNKRWRFRYFFNDKEKMLSLGLYPEISLKKARELHQNACRLVAEGINPSDVRKAEKETKSDTNSFEAVAKEWWEHHKHKWSENHAYQVYHRLEKNIFPWLGGCPVLEITPVELLKHLHRMEDRGAVEMAYRVKTTCGQIFRYAVSTGRLNHDITHNLKDALTPANKRHYPTITDPVKIDELLRAIDGYQGHYITKCALKLSPLTFVRPGEL